MIALSKTSGIATRPKRTFGMNGCINCLLIKQCGGHPLPLIRQLGCANYANRETLDTDDMNPLFPDRFWDLWDDVGGLTDYRIGQLRTMSPTGLPRYIPKFQNKRLKRSRLLDAPVVALGLFDILHKRNNGSYGAKYGSALELRRAYRLRPDTAILLVGVDFDPPIESFWESHRLPGVLQSIRDLGVIGVTVPNFSYFTCAPRFQILRNWKRILLSAARLSAAGIPVAPHLNANTLADWEAVFEFLRDHPEVTVVTMEFQTGARANTEVGEEAFTELVRLQYRIDRPIHPLLVGAARYFIKAKEHFTSFTIIDSQPFMQALSRRILTVDTAGHYVWAEQLTPDGAPLDELIETNMLLYPDKLNAGYHDDATQVSTTDFRQAELSLPTSMPYFTAHP